MKNLFTLRAATTLLLANSAWAASPWLPEPGTAHLTTLFVYDSFVNYRPGAKQGRLPASYIQRTYYTQFEYGLKNTIAVEYESGHTETFHRANGTAGMADTTLGFRYQAYRGESWVVTLRAAGVLAGTYPIVTNGNFSAGDKSSGALGSVLIGKSLPKGFFSFTETGYRVRFAPVPQDFFGTAGIGSGIKRAAWTASYQTSRSVNGTDIVGSAPVWGPYFNPRMFPATKKIFGAMDFGSSYYVGKGVSVVGNYSHFLHGRNVGLKNVIALGIGYNLPFRGPHIP